MNAKWLTIISECLILLGLIVLGSGWNGSASVTGAFPFHSSSVQLTGSASGAHARVGLPSLVLGLGLMVVSLVWTSYEAVRR